MTYIAKQKLKPALVAVALFVAMVFVFVLNSDAQKQAAQTVLMPEIVQVDSAEGDYVVGEKLEKMTPLPVQEIDTETLWLARGIYSETKDAQEQELVAWTIRNRVETGYRGNETYKDAVLDPYQFSAFIAGTRTRALYSSLQADSDESGFVNAVAIAKQVKEADASERPFSGTTRHFYSEQSMKGGKAPNWAAGKAPVKPVRPMELDAKRFRFYENVG